MIRRGRGGDGNVFVGEGGAPDGAESVVAYQELVLDVEATANCQEGFPLALFGALPVTHVQCAAS